MKIDNTQQPNNNATPNSNGDKEFEDLGFGTKLNKVKSRLVNQDGSFNIKRRGVSPNNWNGYLWLITTSWRNFFAILILYYLLANAMFGLIFMAVGVEQLSVETGTTWLDNFSKCFYFSVQTFTTVGYGTISPIGAAANFTAAICALFGLLSVALATGLLFARFSNPTASVIFSKEAIIGPYGKDSYGFMFRIVNARNYQLMDVEAIVSLTWVDYINGKPTRKYAALPLERNKIAMFPLNWTIVHPINEKSPLYGKNRDELKAMDMEFIVIIKAFDDTFSQIVHTQSSYKSADIVIGAKFNPMYFINEKGETVLELDRIDDIRREKLPI